MLLSRPAPPSPIRALFDPHYRLRNERRSFAVLPHDQLFLIYTALVLSCIRARYLTHRTNGCPKRQRVFERIIVGECWSEHDDQVNRSVGGGGCIIMYPGVWSVLLGVGQACGALSPPFALPWRGPLPEHPRPDSTAAGTDPDRSRERLIHAGSFHLSLVRSLEPLTSMMLCSWCCSRTQMDSPAPSSI